MTAVVCGVCATMVFMINVNDHPLLAGLGHNEARHWSQSKLDFDDETSAYEEVEVFLLDGFLVVRARTDLDMLSFYWDTDPAHIEEDAEHIWAFLESLPGVVVDREDYSWERFNIWVDVSPDELATPLESIYDLLDLVEANPDGAAFAALLEARPGSQVIAFWDDLRDYLDHDRAPINGGPSDDAAEGDIPDPGAADSGPV